MPFRTLKSPLNVQVEVTERCNHVCKHCYNHFRHSDQPLRSMSAKEVDMIASEFKRLQVIRATITGGEPLCVPDIAIRLTQTLIKGGLQVSFNSNLTKFDTVVGSRLKDAGIKTILTSLLGDTPELHDSITQTPGSWARARDGIKLAISMGFRPAINMVLLKRNFPRLRQTGDLAASWGVLKFSATRACSPTPIAADFSSNLISLSELRESLSILYELKQRWGYQVDVFEHYPWCALQDLEKYSYLARRSCMAGVTSATIGADGQLRPCGHSSMQYGNVFEEGLEKPWLKMSDWRERKYLGICASCPIVNKCTGGCAVEAMNSATRKDCHCTGPEDILRDLPLRPLPEIKEMCVYDSSDDTVFRDETFGGVIASASGGQVLLDKEAFETIRFLLNRDRSISVASLVEVAKISVENAQELLAQLLRKGIIGLNRERRLT